MPGRDPGKGSATADLNCLSLLNSGLSNIGRSPEWYVSRFRIIVERACNYIKGGARDISINGLGPKLDQPQGISPAP